MLHDKKIRCDYLTEVTDECEERAKEIFDLFKRADEKILNKDSTSIEVHIVINGIGGLNFYYDPR
jgi:hypothetical protein